MRRTHAVAFLTLTALSPLVARAQDKKAERVERTIATHLAEFNENMRGYERELKFFEKTPEFKPLFGLRTQLVAQAAEVARLDTAGRGSGPAILELARGMDRDARKLDAETAALEKRAEAVSNREGRAVAGRMKTHADVMVKAVDKLITMFR